MSATLQLHSVTLAHSDSSTNAPQLRHFDWKRSLVGIPVKNPESKYLLVEPGEDLLVFDGSRFTSIDDTTVFGVSLSPLDPSRYRFTYRTGTDPVLRQDREVDLTEFRLTLTANANGTLTMSGPEGSFMGGFGQGDTVFIPGVTTGDPTAGFNPINEGAWTVLRASGSSVTLMRPLGQDFQGISEEVTPGADAVLVYGAAGVQVGDKVDVSAGFTEAVTRTFEVVAVTSKWFEVISTMPLPLEPGAPGAAGMRFYRGSKRFLRIESDQDCVIRVNGDAGNSQRLTPWTPGDEKGVAEYVRVGPTWALRVLNRASVPANVLVISVE